MTDRFSGVSRDPGLLRGTLSWNNSTGQDVPAFGVIRLSAYDDNSGMYTASIHDGDSKLTFVNGPVQVPSGGDGGSQDWSSSRRCLVASGVTLGATVGPVDGSFEMDTSGTGFIVFSNRDATTGTAAVIRDGGSGSGTGGGGGSSGCCSCECIESGDLYVNGELTSSVWEANIGQVSEKQTHGIITVDAAIHRIEWDPDEEYWFGDVDPDLLSAKYNDGTDATGDTTMSASLIMRVNDNGFTTLTMTITGTVPEP